MLQVPKEGVLCTQIERKSPMWDAHVEMFMKSE